MMRLTSDIRNRDIALDYLAKLRKNQLRERLVAERLEYQREFIEMVERWNARDFSAKWRTALSLRHV